MNTRIKQLRKELGLNQTEFGNRIGVAQTSIAGYETGSRVPLDAVINSICREFNVSEEWLRTGNGDMHPPRTRIQELAEFMRDVMNDTPDSTRSIVVSYLAKWDADDWQAVTEILKKHGFPGETKTEPTP